MVSLVSMPELVMNEILKNLDFRHVQTLRKVCHDLREFIDEHKPDAKISAIYLNFRDKDILVDYGDENVVEYRNRGSNEYFSGIKKTLRYRNYVEMFLKDLGIILSFQISSLTVLSFSQRWNADDSYSKTLEMLISVLKLRKTLLKSKMLNMDVLDQHQLLSILQCLDASALEAIEIRVPLSRQDSQSIELNEVVESEQWKKAGEVRIESERFSFRPEYFKHFSKVAVYVDKLHGEQMEDIKSIFLHSSTMNWFLIVHSEFENEEMYFRSLEHSYRIEDTDVWYFRIKSSSDVLEIKRWLTMRQIRFLRLSTSDAVEGAVIQN